MYKQTRPTTPTLCSIELPVSFYSNNPFTPLNTHTMDRASNKLGPAYPTLSTPRSPLRPLGPSMPIMPISPCTGTTPFLEFKIAKRRMTSKQVTQIDTTIKKIMIHVMRVIFLSEMLSDSISPRSRNTWQRSLRTWMRGLISRYSRTAV